MLIHQMLPIKADLTTLRSKGNKLDIDKLETAPTNLSKLSTVVGKNVIKKAVHV